MNNDEIIINELTDKCRYYPEDLKSIHKRKDKLLLLLKVAEDLKCCGNCKQHHNDRMAVRMDRCNSRVFEKVCERWEPDGKTKEERMK